MFLFVKVRPLPRISAILDHVGGVRAQTPPKKVYIVYAESVPQSLEIFNFNNRKCYTDET